MDAHHLQELIDLEENYWWHVAKRQLITSLLRSRIAPPGLIVEGGIGSARNLLEFQQLGFEVCGLDVMSASVAYARERGLERVFEHDLQEPWPVEPHTASAVVMLDVLEHVADPVRVLKHAAETLRRTPTVGRQADAKWNRSQDAANSRDALRGRAAGSPTNVHEYEPTSDGGVAVLTADEESPGTVASSTPNGQQAGCILVTVPAYPWLFGDWDRQLGHYRRYTPRMLRDQVAQAGLRVERLGYWNSFTLPAALAIRTYQRLVPGQRTTEFPRVSPTMNRCLLTAAACERPWARVGWVPCGLSLVGVITL